MSSSHPHRMILLATIGLGKHVIAKAVPPEVDIPLVWDN